MLRAVFRRSARTGAWESHHLYHGHIIYDSQIVDEALAVLMRAPRSYTREDVAELHVHGGYAAASQTLGALQSLGVRAAQPGEFTRRAFENGRIDLSQAEAAMRLIGAASDAAAREAVRALSGGTSRFIKDARERLVELLAELEAAIDFPDEVEESIAAADAARRVANLRQEIEEACDARAGRIIEDGLDVVIAGPPNAGKSSLLNALLGEDRAIVYSAPGTTRDVLTARMAVNGVCVNLSDTAGLRETSDPVEAIGVERAKARAGQADLMLLVIDSSQPLPGDLPELVRGVGEGQLALLLNKCDLPERVETSEATALAGDVPCVRTSTFTGEGLDSVRGIISRAVAQATREGVELTAARHIAAARKAAALLLEAEKCLRLYNDGGAISLAIVDLDAALRALCEITGESADAAVIDAVFANFCVGK